MGAQEPLPHLEVILQHLRFCSLEISKAPCKVPLNSPRRLLGACLHLLYCYRSGGNGSPESSHHSLEPTDWWRRSKKPHTARTGAW